VLDSWRHNLIECNMSRSVWAWALETIIEHIDHMVGPAANQWIFSMILALSHEELMRCFVTLWAIWFARRKVIREDIFQSPLSTHYFVESFIRDLEYVSLSKKK
jgi:hypothetical protein